VSLRRLDIFLVFKFGVIRWALSLFKHLRTIFYYAALLPRRGPHIASHSVRPSVCPSLCPSRYCLLKNIGHVFSSTLRTCGIFCFVYMSGPHIVRRSQPHKLVRGIVEQYVQRAEPMHLVESSAQSGSSRLHSSMNFESRN